MTSSTVSTAEPGERLPTFADVEAAASRLAGKAIVTPLIENPLLNERIGGRVLIKPEVLQRTGSFKFRGAYNTISRLSAEAKQHGVVAYSSGNHAQGVAAAAQLLGIPATIVMPSDAPRIKIDNTKHYGAKLIHYDRFSESREEIAQEVMERTGAFLIRPYDDPNIIAGQGTCGLEIGRQAAALGVTPDAVLFCCGGGGLSSGSALALAEISPASEIYTVEPEGFDDTARSLAAGHRVSIEDGQRSICDALLTPTPGRLTFDLNRKFLAGGLVVSDSEVRDAVRVAFRILKLVVEPGGAVCLAAVLNGRLPVAGRTTAIVLTGGNVDPATYAEIIRPDD